MESDGVKGRLGRQERQGCWRAGTRGVMAEEAYGMGRIEKRRERKEGWRSGAAKCVLMSRGNTNCVVHRKKKQQKKLQDCNSTRVPCPPCFAMCQDSGPTEVIEREHGGGAEPGQGGSGAAGQATPPSQLDRGDSALSSCGSV